MIDLAIVFGLAVTDRIFGESSNSASMIAESVAINRESRDAVLSIAQSTNEVTKQIAVSGLLLAESMKNDNLRRLQEIRLERRRILNS